MTESTDTTPSAEGSEIHTEPLDPKYVTLHSRLPLRRIAVEFLTIVAGVLVALAAQSWYEDRRERGMESGYLQGLVATVAADLESIELSQELVKTEKQPGIAYLHSVIDGSVAEPDPRQLISALEGSASMGWTIPPRVTSVYDELVSTGRLMLIQERQLLSAVGSYYKRSVHSRDQIYARRTKYPERVVSLVPATARAQVRRGELPGADVAARLLLQVRDPSFQELLNAEEFYMEFMMASLAEERQRAEAMLQHLQTALAASR